MNQRTVHHDDGVSIDEEDAAPVFILCSARSGSTLLRRILDAHPFIYCPSETNLARAFEAMRFSVRALYARYSEEEADLIADDLCRRIVQRTMSERMRATGKRMWCDKSLMTIHLVEHVRRVFPHARFLCLYRNCEDTIASAMEASPWGYASGVGAQGGYGFEQYVRESPGNVVFALAAYWGDVTSKIRSCETTWPESCLRVRYEDLVRSPTEKLNEISNWLGVELDDGFMQRSDLLAQEQGPSILGDYKIRYTRKIDARAIGRGWRIPSFELVHPDLRPRIDSLSNELGYPAIGDEAARLAMMRDQTDQGWTNASTVERTVASIRHRVENDSHPIDGRLRIQLVDEGQVAILIDFDEQIVTIESPPALTQLSSATATVITNHDTLRDILGGQANIGVASRRGDLRYIGDPDGETRTRYLDAIAICLAPTEPELELKPEWEADRGGPLGTTPIGH